MKRWLIPATTLLVGAAVAAGIALSVTQPWQSREPEESEPAFTRFEILRLTETQISEMPFPQGTNWVKCVEGEYHAGNGLWLVTCNFYENRQAKEQLYARTYAISDQTGKLQR